MQSPAPGTAFGQRGGTAAALRHPMIAAVAVAIVAHLLLLRAIAYEQPEPEPPAVHTFEVMTVEQPADAGASPLADAVGAPVNRAGETSVPLPEVASGSAPDAPEPPDKPQPEPADLQVTEPPAPADASEPDGAPEQPAIAPAAPRQGPGLAGTDATPGGFSKPALDVTPPDLTEVLSGMGADIALPDLPSAAAAPASAPHATATDVFASRNLEIAALTARINARDTSQAGRPRRKAISTNTREYRYAAYMEAWRRKVEAIGNLNYPQAAKERELFGSLILHVAIKSDGSLEGVRVVRSSGYDVLDQAAINIVKLAAPYAPFPKDIKAETDVLDITRVWQFQRNHRLGWD
ncbi:MAG: TonB family protein [Thiohalocapsa sp.]|uniref:TonB family protein n=1 Tax=Thiohalocapsa sp. TaxID=2497641 RepID=UPI0025F0B6F4|nr:TonB family protein [Thiohalocapsa sp.]MCG6942668.1 TonB family protein [Thiohalocapsa sp.]